MMKRILPLFVSLTLFACSASEQPKPETAPESAQRSFRAVEIYLSRGQLMNEPEFEQYSLVESRLFKECGTIRRGRHVPQEQIFEPVPEEIQSGVSEIAAEVAPLAEEKSRFKLEKADKGNKFYGAGEALFTLRGDDGTLTFETSLDSLSEPSNQLERKLAELVERMRGAAGPMCGNQTFFGLGRQA